ncbi:MAG: D-sedoheptulose 7-phosphate isomerase [Gammaproteobacteria bacterium]|jgi:D-sedoheptulose 7-phosphate isomerase
MLDHTSELADYFYSQLNEHEALLQATRQALEEPFAKWVQLATQAIRSGGKIILFGNGGSAADAQHIATELTVRYTQFREPIAAVALTTDTSALTAIGNDYGFEHLFARQLQALGREADLAIAISTSGNSPNVIRALAMAQQLGMRSAALTGGGGGELTKLTDPVLIVPSHCTARIQEMHITLGHMFCGALERSLALL